MLFTDERHDACGNDEEAVSGDGAKSWRMKVCALRERHPPPKRVSDTPSAARLVWYTP
jgi:hypothetical protein